MTDKERYDRAMSHDFPKDCLSDDEWDFIEAMASCRGDGVKNKSITAGRMPKSGGVKNMAKRQTNNSQRTVQEKRDYYGRRVNDPKLSEGQRKHAQRRLNELCGNNKRKNQSPKPAPRKSTLPATAQQNNAKMAGIGFGAAKAGARVPVAPENQQSFRAGVEVGRALGNKF